MLIFLHIFGWLIINIDGIWINFYRRGFYHGMLRFVLTRIVSIRVNFNTIISEILIYARISAFYNNKIFICLVYNLFRLNIKFKKNFVRQSINLFRLLIKHLIFSFKKLYWICFITASIWGLSRANII